LHKEQPPLKGIKNTERNPFRAQTRTSTQHQPQPQPRAQSQSQSQYPTQYSIPIVKQAALLLTARVTVADQIFTVYRPSSFIYYHIFMIFILGLSFVKNCMQRVLQYLILIEIEIEPETGTETEETYK